MKPPRNPIQELRRKHARKEQLIAEYRQHASQFPGSDLASRMTRNYYQGRMEHFQREKAEIERQLKAMGHG